MDTIPNEIIEQIYYNLDMKDSAMLSLASRTINECRPDFSLIKHKTLFAHVIVDINKIKYIICGRRRRSDRREYTIDGYYDNPKCIKCVDEPQEYSIREINGRMVAAATFADTFKSKTEYESEYSFRYTVEIYSNIESTGMQIYEYRRRTWKLQNKISKFFDADASVYVYSYSNTQKLLI